MRRKVNVDGENEENSREILEGPYPVEYPTLEPRPFGQLQGNGEFGVHVPNVRERDSEGCPP